MLQDKLFAKPELTQTEEYSIFNIITHEIN